MDLQSRKNIRLKSCDYGTNGAYFVTICTDNRKCCLSRIVNLNKVGDDAHIVPLLEPKIELLEFGMVAKRYLETIPSIDKYVIMPNHIHMIIIINNGSMRASTPTVQSIPQRVKSFKGLVSKAIGGSIWQRNYYEKIIRDEKSYIAACKYIEENPPKWELDKYYAKQ